MTNSRGKPITAAKVRKPTPAQRKVDEFNEETPVGSRVRYRCIGGKEWKESTVSKPAAVHGLVGVAVVWLEGITGFWLLSHVEPLSPHPYELGSCPAMTPAPDPEALRPCPFCGGPARKGSRRDESLWSHEIVAWHSIGCPECDYHIERCEHDDELLALWNSRPVSAECRAASTGESGP